MRDIIMAIKILGAADGFLPKARIEAYPNAPITTDGPKIVINMTNIMIKLRNLSDHLSIIATISFL